MTNPAESAPRPVNGPADSEPVGDGTDPQATDVSGDVDAEMLRDDIEQDEA